MVQSQLVCCHAAACSHCRCSGIRDSQFKGDDWCHRIHVKVFFLLSTSSYDQRVLVIMANSLSRILTAKASAAVRLTLKASASVDTSTGSKRKTLKVAVMNCSHVDLEGELDISR